MKLSQSGLTGHEKRFKGSRGGAEEARCGIAPLKFGRGRTLASVHVSSCGRRGRAAASRSWRWEKAQAVAAEGNGAAAAHHGSRAGRSGRRSALGKLRSSSWPALLQRGLAGGERAAAAMTRAPRKRAASCAGR